MGGLHLFEKEELVAQFRPSRLSYGRRYLTSFGWTVAGILGATASVVMSNHPLAYGYGTLAAFAFLTALVRARARRNEGTPLPVGTWFAILVLVVTTVLGAAAALATMPAGPFPPAGPLAAGAGATVLRIGWWEFHRLNRIHFLTNERIVIRGGTTRRTERTVPLRKVLEVRGDLGMMGQFFDYGNITLVLGRRRGAKDGTTVEDTEVLRGIRQFTQNKHRVEELVQESQLPDRERSKRMEERRVKDSMRLLSQWMRREGNRRAA